MDRKRFSNHSKIRLGTTKEFFLIESVKICDNLNNENQYLCLQLNCLNQIKCHKSYSPYLKLILLLSGDIRLNRGQVQKDHLKLCSHQAINPNSIAKLAINQKLLRKWQHYFGVNVVSGLSKLSSILKIENWNQSEKVTIFCRQFLAIVSQWNRMR